ncbi:MAG: SMI1/KNR4 family protein [Planctomycetes bacterium]|nr:SMI1/KNR4 family protein [Planctomycetota bacterium]
MHPVMCELLARNPQARRGVGAAPEAVNAAEAALGISLPEVVRALFEDLGYAGLPVGRGLGQESYGKDTYGLGDGVPRELDLVRNTLSERSDVEPRMPTTLVPLVSNGCGDHYCVDLRSPSADPPVVFWDHELGSDQQPAVVSETFSGWLLGGMGP